MGVGVNLFPTGQPLPLISMGGTSILFTCISLGIILNISRTVYKDSADVNELRIIISEEAQEGIFSLL